MVLFLFSDYLNLWFNSMECARRLWSSEKLNSKGLTLKLLSFQHKSLICYQNQTAAKTKFYAELYEDTPLLEIFIPNKNHRLLDNPLSPIQDLNTNFHLEPKSRKPKI